MSSRQSLADICDQVYRQFPEVAGSQPRVQPQPGDRLLLVFRGNVKAADGRTIPRNVRVVVSPVGKIEKITTSR